MSQRSTSSSNAGNGPSYAGIKDAGRKACLQCQNSMCRKNAVDAQVTLSKCKGCKQAMYCSRECQRASWPQHRTLCEEARLAAASLAPEMKEKLMLLAGYTDKMKPYLSAFGTEAFDLPNNPTRGHQDALLIKVQRNTPAPKAKGNQQAQSSSKKIPAEKAYKALDARLVPLSSLDSLGASQKEAEAYVQHYSEMSGPGEAVVTMVVMDVDGGPYRTIPFTVDEEAIHMSCAPLEWKDALLYTLSSGKSC